MSLSRPPRSPAPPRRSAAPAPAPPRRRSLLRLPLLGLLLAAAGAGCQKPPPRGQAQVVSFAPAGTEVSDAQLAGGLRVVFDRPVAPPKALGTPLAAALRIAPPLPGEARWLDRQTLLFFPSGKLQPSTAYSVSLDRALVVAPDVGLARWPGARFVHQRLEIESVTFAGARQYQPRTPVATLRATLPVRPTQALAACAFFERDGDGKRGARTPLREVHVRAEDEEAPRGDGASRVLRLGPARPLATGTSYVFRCDATLRPAAGGEGLAPDHETRLATLGSPGIKQISPSGSDLSADAVRVEITFDTPMEPRLVRKHIHLTRAQDERWVRVPMDLAGDATRTTFAWTADLEPGTAYRVEMTAGLADAFGQKLAPPDPHTFQVGDAAPRLVVQQGIHLIERASGHYPIWTRNLPSHRVRCAAVPEARLAAVLKGTAEQGDGWQIDGAVLGQPGALAVRERTFAGKPPHNRWVDAGLPLGKTCGGGPSGFYVLEITSEDRKPRRALANVTDLGVLAKVGSASSLVWVVRLSTGRPVPHAQVKIRDLDGKVRFTGKTNADGVALAPGAGSLGAADVAAGHQPQGGGGEEGGQEGDQSQHLVRRAIVTAQAGDDLAVVDTSWRSGVQSWNFGVEVDRGGGSARVRGFLHSDRGLYRPGDTVHLRGLVRRIDAAGRMAVPGQRKLRVVVEDPRGAAVLEDELTISAYGAFSRDLALAPEAHLGDYVVRGELDGQTFLERFSVEEYRPRTFEVKLGTPKKDVFVGQRLQFTVSASYLHGSPLRDAQVTWNVRRRAYVPAFAGFEGYAFQDEAALFDGGRAWARNETRSFSDHVADGELKLDADGRATISAVDPSKDSGGPQHYLLQASVKDANGDEVLVSEMVAGHRANLYLGVQPAAWVAEAGRPLALALVALDAEGKRRGARARVTVTRRHYQCDAGDGEGACQGQTDQTDQPSVDVTVAVSDAGGATVEHVTLKQPGEYLVSATAPDGRGQQAVSTQLIYVAGEGDGSWNSDGSDRMMVVASRPRYRPGEVARLLPQARLPGAVALVTLERDGVLSYLLRTLETSGEAIDVPIEARLAPNVFASVALARGRIAPGIEGRPRLRVGMVNLAVEDGGKRLAVAIETDRPSYQPGDLVKARVSVTGRDGAPVRGELALAVADEGVLLISGFKTPNPLPVFYAPWALGVESSMSWNRLLVALDEPGDDSYEENDDEENGSGGDAGGEEAGRIRSRFMATAFWAPSLVTDAAGKVEVSFRAPDNLTAFRVMAVVADAGDRFGSGEQRFTVRKPLQAVPALPRFLTVGDRVAAAVVVHNNTGAPLAVSVSAAAEGVALAGDVQQTVDLPVGGLRRVTFAATARAPGEATFTFRAAGGPHSDAVRVKIPVASAGTPAVLVVGEGSSPGRVEHALPALGTVIPGRASLEVSLDPTGMGRLEEGLRYLIGYPHGCLEQTTSKMVPMISLTDLARTVDLAVASDEARKFVQAGIAKVLRHQHEDGGFGLWPGTPPEVHYTAYGLWGLQVARAAGFAVDARALERGASYLRERLVSPAESGDAEQLAAQGGEEAFAAYVLAALGQADGPALGRLFARRQHLPVFARAFLARALAAAGRPAEAATLADELGALVGGAGPAIVREGGGDLGWYWSSDTRTTALVLSALLEVKPKHPAVGPLAEGLLAARTGGRWASTQENLFSLLALAQLAKVRVATEVRATIALAGKPVGQAVVKGRTVRVRVPVGERAAGPLVITSQGGPLFYAARVRVERPLALAAPADHGIAVERAYLDPQSGEPITDMKVGQVARVRVTVRSQDRRAHVAVIDPLPAGVEPVLMRFQPTMAAQGRGASQMWRQARTAWQHEQLRDDRAEVFADVLAAGESTHHYFVRAVAAGTFAAAPATAEAMYRAEVRGQTGAATLVVQP